MINSVGRPGRSGQPLRRLGTRGQARGFTLIEMMMVVAVLAILAAVAWPSYQDFIRRGNRTDAKAILMESAQFMERYYTTNGTFVGAAVLTAASPRGATGTRIRYNISFTAAPDALTFTLQAVPVPGSMQAGDVCGTLTISNTGATTPATAGCW